MSTSVLLTIVLVSNAHAATYFTHVARPEGLAKPSPIAFPPTPHQPGDEEHIDLINLTPPLEPHILLPPLMVPEENLGLDAIVIKTNGNESSSASKWTLTAEDSQLPTNTSLLEVQKRIVTQHNFYRRLEIATDMLKMEWNSEAAANAQEWANKCAWGHDSYDDRHTSQFTCGQNIARSRSEVGWDDVVAFWADEIVNFRFDQNATGIVGHYTQLVWAKTFQVGCGYQHCPDNDPAFHFYVCNYCPAGNVVPKHFAPYKPSSEVDGHDICQACGGSESPTCDHGLCMNACNHTNTYSNCDHSDHGFPALLPDGCTDSSPVVLAANCQATCNCRPLNLIY